MCYIYIYDSLYRVTLPGDIIASGVHLFFVLKSSKVLSMFCCQTQGVLIKKAYRVWHPRNIVQKHYYFTRQNFYSIYGIKIHFLSISNICFI